MMENQEEVQQEVATDDNDLKKQIATLNHENAQRRLNEKGLAEELEKLKAEKQEAEEAAQAERGEYKTLYETLKSETEAKDGKISAYEGALTKLLEAEMANMPENMHALIPSGDVSSKLEWIATAKEANLFGKPSGPEVREPGEKNENSISRQAFEKMTPVKRQEYLAKGGRLHD